MLFCRSLPRNTTVMSWNSEVVVTSGKYLGLSNMGHNIDLTAMNSFSFTVVVLGATMQEMDQYSGLYIVLKTFSITLSKTSFNAKMNLVIENALLLQVLRLVLGI